MSLSWQIVNNVGGILYEVSSAAQNVVVVVSGMVVPVEMLV
jgi:hypothetical protein